MVNLEPWNLGWGEQNGVIALNILNTMVLQKKKQQIITLGNNSFVAWTYHNSK